MRGARKKGKTGGVFMAPLLASSLALVATNLLNVILGKIL